MRTFLFAVVIAIAVSLGSSLVYADMQAAIDRAATIIGEFREMPEQSIPPEVLISAKGLVVMTIGKAGFIISGRGGDGVVLLRTPDGNWSAPSYVGLGGAGLGFQIGAEITDFVFVLNSQQAADAFLKGGNVTIGGNLSATAGPIGRTGEAGIGSTAIFAYSRTKGLFAGVSAEGTIIEPGNKTNEVFYARPITTEEILTGKVPHPASANALYEALAVYALKVETVTTTTTKTVK